MYQIEQKNYGFKLTFKGNIKTKETQQWLNDSEKLLESIKGPFAAFVDMKDLLPVTQEAQQPFIDGQRLYKRKGMTRSVVILNGDIIKMQFQRIERATGIYEWERYLDASVVANCEEVGLSWMINGIDPDK